MSFISDAFAQAQTAAPTEPGLAANVIPLLLIFAVFYIFLIRPQQKKMKAHTELVSALKRGDEVVAAGIYGKVVKLEEGTNIVQVEIAPDVVIKVNRSAVSDVVGKEEKKADKNVSKK
jgi:preprotein translocase subunit YajC